MHDTLGCWNLNHEFRLHVLCQIHLSSAVQKPRRLNFLKFYDFRSLVCFKVRTHVSLRHDLSLLPERLIMNKVATIEFSAIQGQDMQIKSFWRTRQIIIVALRLFDEIFCYLACLERGRKNIFRARYFNIQHSVICLKINIVCNDNLKEKTNKM